MCYAIEEWRYTRLEIKKKLFKSTASISDLYFNLKTIHCRSETIVMKTRADQGHIEMTTIKGPFLKRAMYVNFCLLKTVYNCCNCFCNCWICKDVDKLLIRVQTGWKEIQNEMKIKKCCWNFLFYRLGDEEDKVSTEPGFQDPLWNRL